MRSMLRDLSTSLVEIPSHEDETAVGEFIVDWLREETAASVSTDETGNVFARIGTGHPSLALVGHHDVVEPDVSQVDGEEYLVEVEDGRLYGRGSADMKGALAAMLLVLKRVDPAGELVFASFVGEEQGGVGAREAIDDGFSPEYAVVGEGSASYSAPGVLDVAIAHKGRRGSTVEASGTAAHASEPERGENAIYRATDAVRTIRDLPAPSATVLGHEVEGSLVVTEIDGGSAWNVVPESCTVTVDERTVPGDRADLGAIESIAGVDWSVDQDLPPMQCPDREFADHVLEASRNAHTNDEGSTDESGHVPEHVIKPHATDAGWLSQAGTTCVVCGPAEPGEAHTATESVSLSLLERTYECYLHLAESWPGQE
ncbi:MAG: M20 family metallopeptidase [Halodesulfurarchaeum sp.]